MPKRPPLDADDLRRALSDAEADVSAIRALVPTLRGTEGDGELNRHLNHALPALVRIDDALGHEYGPAYYDARGSADDGRCLMGAIYARQRADHGLARVVGGSWSSPAGVFVRRDGEWVAVEGEFRLGPTGPVTTPDRLKVFRYAWRLLADLPSPDPGHAERRGRDQAYRDHLEGRPVVDGLDAALAFLRRFAAERGLLAGAALPGSTVIP